METISISRFCRSEGNLKKRFEERKKRRKAKLSRRHRRSMPQGPNADRRRRSPSIVRRPTARLSVKIPSHRSSPLSPTSCEIFDPNERPPARRPYLPPPPPPPPYKLERGRGSYIWAWGLVKRHRFVFGGDKTTSFHF